LDFICLNLRTDHDARSAAGAIFLESRELMYLNVGRVMPKKCGFAAKI
jgi:hypothetical protein